MPPTGPANRNSCRGRWRNQALSLWSRKPASPLCLKRNCYLPLTMEQWVAAVFHVPESLIQVSLQITVRARCVPLSSAS